MGAGRRPEDADLQSLGRFRWQWMRVRRHLRWAREQGIARLIEEDGLNPIERARARAQKARWRKTHDHRPNAVPVFLVGAQRSGTNMVVRGLERSPEFEVHNENDRAAFVRFRLRPLPEIRRIVEASPHAFVLFKPLCDSHRVVELLEDLGTPSPGKAIWVYRSYEGRVRSSVAKFGDANLRALRRIAADGGSWMWQAGGLSPERLELVRRFDLGAMDPASASALFWFLRNSLYFDLGLDEREDVILVSYDATVADPERAMGDLASFLGIPYTPALAAHIELRATAGGRVELDPRVRSLCEDLLARLDARARPTSQGHRR
jgi:hypothetical protein